MSTPFSQLIQHFRQTFSGAGRRPSASHRNRRPSHSLVTGIAAEIELLEQRTLLSAAPVPSGMTAEPTLQVEKLSAPSGGSFYTPSQIQTAYGFNQVSLQSGPNGTGQTIAIVDAYDDPTIQTDLRAFDSAFGLMNPPSLKVVSQTGSTTNLPPTDPSANTQNNWEVEESLDVEWAHALAPGANIVLVEANSNNLSDLFAAVRTAASLPGVSVVSMSWGGPEFSLESIFDSYFTTPAGHQGVTFVASTGDSGAPSEYPAYSPNVLAVGGTTLNLAASGNYLSETAWSESGGGTSQYESQPVYQAGVVTQTTTQRAAPDVAFDADPHTGVPIYDSFSFGTTTPWVQIGGTSVGAPSWAAVIAIADQGRVQNGLGTLDGASQTLPMLYQLHQSNPSDFHDITSGNNGFPAGTGYDLVTGLGSPVVNLLVSGLDRASSPPVSPPPTSPPPTSPPPASPPPTTPRSTSSKLAFQQLPTAGTAGQALGTVTVAVENQNGQVVTTDNSTVSLTIGGGPGGFATNSTVSAKAINGIATFTNLVLDAAGSYQLSANDAGLAGSTSHSFTINPAAASKVAFVQVPATGKVGVALPSTAVAVEDQFGNVVTSNKSIVTISVANGNSSFTAASTTNVAAISGIAIFNNLVLGTSGVYTFNATDGSLTHAVSSSITLPSIASTGFTVTATVLSSNSVGLNWTPVAGAQSYGIYFTQGPLKYLLTTVSAGTDSLRINGLLPGTTYQFQIVAFRGSSILLNSNWVSVNSAAATVK